MSRRILVLWAARRDRGTWEELCRGYRDRVVGQVDLVDKPVLSKAGGSARSRLRSEGEALQGAIPPRSWVVALDRRGRQLDSLAFSRRLQGLLEDQPHGICFVLGSDLGLSPALLEAADEQLSLGPMTLPHQLARLVLYEQIYRALSIVAGMKYHRVPLV